MTTYDEPPTKLKEKLRDIALKSEALLERRQHVQAEAGFQKMYKILLNNQPVDGRYHKGYELHNIGTATLYSGKPQKALKSFLLAYVEDLLSQKEGEEDKADALPAGKTLSGYYLVDESLLAALKKLAQKFKTSGTLIQDPDRLVKDLDKTLSKYLSDKIKELAVTEPLRRPGQFQSQWKDRVFVGGSYSNHVAEISRIGDICMKLGFDPVIASKFETPPDKVHHHALMLLHECKMAIFEVSDDVGQLMEIERLRDYQISALMLCQKDKTRLSAMLKTLFEASDCEFRQYDTMKEMETHVKLFLKPKKK